MRRKIQRIPRIKRYALFFVFDSDFHSIFRRHHDAEIDKQRLHISREEQCRAGNIGEILRQIQRRLMMCRNNTDLLQNMRDEMRTEEVEFALIGNPQKRQKQTHGRIVHAALVCNKIFNLFFDLLVGFRGNLDLIQLDRVRLSARFEIAGQRLDTETIEHEAVKGAGVFLQTEGDMRIIVS